MIEIKNYINGSLSFDNQLNKIDVVSPINGRIYARCLNSDSNTLNSAIKSAKKAFPKWKKLSINDRSQYLLNIADLLENKIDEFSKYESIDNGKPYKLSKNLDIPRAIENLRFFASIARGLKSDSFIMEGKGLNYTIKEPLGLVGTITPWNLPLYLFTWKIAPAIVTGNCVIAKPSEITPMTAYLFSKLCIEAKLPKGVLNIIHGKGEKIGSEIVNHKGIKAISFTGGTETGKKISNDCSNTFKKLNLEMGGKNPVLVFDDCNYSKMLDSIVKSSFLNQGQICLAGSRIYIQKNIYKKFKKDFIKKVEKIIVGDPFNKESDQGAIVSEEHFNKILNYINISKEEGCKVLTGGMKVDLNDEYRNGWYIRPTIIENFDNDSRINQEEVFGPVVTLNSFENDQDALKLANDSNYGLASIIWTENINRAHKFANEIDSGIVWINCWLERDLRTPFGGVKNSGYGKEGGYHALDFFTKEKNICIKYYD